MCNHLESQWNWLLLYLVISRGRFQWQTMNYRIWVIQYDSYYYKSYFWVETLWKPDYYYNYRLVAGFIPIIVVFISYYTVQKALTMKQGVNKVTRTAESPGMIFKLILQAMENVSKDLLYKRRRQGEKLSRQVSDYNSTFWLVDAFLHSDWFRCTFKHWHFAYAGFLVKYFCFSN